MTGNSASSAAGTRPGHSVTEADFRASLEGLVEGIGGIVWEYDPPTRLFTHIGGAAERVLGYPVEQWLSEPGFADRILAREADRAALHSLSGSEPRLRGEWRLTARDGRSVRARVQLHRAAEGDSPSPRIRGLMVDITGERESSERTQVEPVGSWEWDVAGGTVELSEDLCRMYGFDAPLLRCTLENRLALVVPEDRERVRGILQRAVRSGDAFEFDERIVRSDGRLRVLHTRGRAVAADGDDTAVRVVGSSRDVTESRGTSEREMELIREQALRMIAEQDERRSALLAEVGRATSASADQEATLQGLGRALVPEFADWCAIDLVDDEGNPQRIAAVHADPTREKPVQQMESFPAPLAGAAYGLSRVLRTGKAEMVGRVAPELLERWASADEHLRSLLDLDLRSYMVVPLRAHGRVLGAISLFRAGSGGEYDPGDLVFAEELARRVALALDNARLYREAQRARAQTTSILESITDAFFVLDGDRRFTYVNQPAEQVLSGGREELLGKRIWDQLPSSLADGFRTRLESAAAENRTVQFEIHHPVLDAWFAVRVYPSAEGIAVYFHDVTARVQAADAVRASEEQFRFLADAIPQQVWITAPDGYHQYYNRRWYDFTGTREEEARGEGWAAILHPDDVDRARQRWQRSLATGEPYSIEYRFRRASDGQYRWFLGQAMPQHGPRGEIVRWFGTLTDIQDRKEEEAERERLIAELELERSRLHQIFAEAPAFIATLSGPDHVFESANPLYLQLVGHRDVLGKPAAEALPEVVGQGFIELLDEVLESGQPFLGRETRILLQREPGAENEERILNFVYQPILDVRGKPSGIFVHGVDVTDQVRAREQVEEKADELLRITRQLELSNRELDQFAYVASHDLKAPLRGIANLSQWIEEDFGTDVSQDAREHLELLRGRVHRMEGLIDGILEYSRAGRVREKPERVDVEELLTETIDLLAPPAAATIRVAEMPTLEAERLPLQQVLMNLIGNALKYSGAEPEVEISAADAGAFYQFTVRDDGPGIAPEFHDRIFGIFQTLEARDKVEGTGIGLSLVRKIVDSRRGRVWVESEVGAGASFHFLWPKHQQAGR